MLQEIIENTLIVDRNTVIVRFAEEEEREIELRRCWICGMILQEDEVVCKECKTELDEHMKQQDTVCIVSEEEEEEDYDWL